MGTAYYVLISLYRADRWGYRAERPNRDPNFREGGARDGETNNFFFLPNLAVKLICLTFIVLEDHLLLSQLYRRTALCICFEARCRKLSRLNPFCYPPVF